MRRDYGHDEVCRGFTVGLALKCVFHSSKESWRVLLTGYISACLPFNFGILTPDVLDSMGKDGFGFTRPRAKMPLADLTDELDDLLSVLPISVLTSLCLVPLVGSPASGTG